MRKILIISGIVFVLVAVGIWVYLLIFKNSPDNTGSYAGLPNGEQNPNGFTTREDVETNTTTHTEARPALRQITTEAVAGATILNTDTVRFARRGTGEIFDFSLSNSTETLVTTPSLLGVVEVTFAQAGHRAIFTSENSTSQTSLLGDITRGDNGASSFALTQIPTDASSISFSPDSTKLLFLRSGTSGSVGYEYTIATNDEQVLFTTPLTQVQVLWGDGAQYLYTNPSRVTQGYLYKVSGQTVTFVHKGEFGLVGSLYQNRLVGTYFENGELVSYYLEDGIYFPFTMIPEKCTVDPIVPERYFCASPDTLGQTYPDEWYKGTVTYTDRLYEFDNYLSTLRLLSDFTAESGQQIDVAQIGTNEDGSLIYFINKIDGTLWLFDINIYEENIRMGLGAAAIAAPQTE